MAIKMFHVKHQQGSIPCTGCVISHITNITNNIFNKERKGEKQWQEKKW